MTATRWAMFGLVLVSGSLHAGEPIQFRGPAGTGVLPKIEHPLEWAANKNIAWAVPVPGAGWSAPIVVGDKVILTTAVGDKVPKPKNFAQGASDPSSNPIPFLGGGPKLPTEPFRFEVHCLSLTDGKSLWKSPIAEKKPAIPTHPSNTYATETPASDGERIFAYFGCIGTVACLDLNGKLLWEKEIGTFPVLAGFGTGSSLTVADGRLFVQYDNEKKSAIYAFDAKTGKELWKRDREVKSSWSTPLLWRNSVRTELIVCGSGWVTSYDPATGEEFWKLGKTQSGFSASPAIDGDTLYFGCSAPFSSSPLWAIRAGATGDLTIKGEEKSNSGVKWYRTKSAPGMASPVALDGFLYITGEGGLITCLDGKTGEPVYKERLPKGKMGAASLWAGDGKIFVLDEVGQTFIVKSGREFEVIGTNKLDDTFWSTPTVAGNVLLMRGVEKLYCIRK